MGFNLVDHMLLLKKLRALHFCRLLKWIVPQFWLKRVSIGESTVCIGLPQILLEEILTVLGDLNVCLIAPVF